MPFRALWVVFLLLVLPSVGRSQVYEGKTVVQSRLVADTTAIVPGKPFRVGLVLEMAEGWHTYWEYGGDAGAPTRIEWELPEGFAVGLIEWPVPQAILEPGDILVYAYKGEVMLIQTLRAPDDLPPGTIELKAKASWLACAEICIPGGAELSLELPVATTAEPTNTALFEKWESRVPTTGEPPFAVEWMRDGDRISGKIAATPGVEEVQFFPLPSEGQIVGHPKIGGSASKGFTIEIDVTGDGSLAGVLGARTVEGERAWRVDAGPSASSTPDAAAAGDVRDSVGGGQEPSGAGLAGMLLFGFLGGIILNLMPCVLPVISLKIFGFVRQAGQSRQVIFRHGLAFTAGVFAWFLGLAAIIAGIKAGGGEATWAFQFQNPWFILTMATIVFVFALNLFGVFEITLPGRATTRMAEAGGHEGLGGSFFQGVFATLLATPCTGPFLGSALGYAFSQTAGVVFAMFASIAAGMALPYLLLSAQPDWIRFLPKPGTWMERLKQFMGFPLLAALVWLLSVLGGQLGIDGIIASAAFLVCVGLACWLYGLATQPGATGRSRIVSLVTAAVVVIGGGWFFIGGIFAASPEPAETGRIAQTRGGIPWEPYSKARVDELLAEGKPVFIDFTADWCLTCKYNERVAIDKPAVRERIRELGIVPIKADWTNTNPEITEALRAFGRVGVPFYVYYPAGDAKNPVTFPELLTESIVLEKLSAPQGVESSTTNKP